MNSSGPSTKKIKVGTGENVVGQWGNLPNDILSLIRYHLFGKDYICFVSVCRSWRSTPPPLRPNPYVSEARSQYPSLFHFSDDRSECKLYDPFYNTSYVAQIPDELMDSRSRIYSSNYGWLLMSLGDRFFFFHPFTYQRIYISDYPLDDYAKICFSSRAPTSPFCKVFGIGGNGVITIFRKGKKVNKWIHHADNSFLETSSSNPVFYKDAFYCLSSDGILGVSDIRKAWQWKIINKLKHPCESIEENFLVESNGQLLSICMGRNGEYVKIFRLNYHEIRWEEVDSLGDNMVFACQTGCISVQTDTMRNTIYFPRFDNQGNGLFYSLASRKFHSLGLTLARNDLYNTKQMLHCVWIMPTAAQIYTEDELRRLPWNVKLDRLIL